MLLTFNINKQIIRRTDCEIPVANSENYLRASFSFSNEWQGYKTAIFNNGTAYSIILDENNECLVPWEVITASGFSVSVFCGERITANTVFVSVLPSGYKEGETPQPPSPTVYDQILETLRKKLEAGNIKAGDNITITVAGGNVYISSTGGGGGTIDYTELENKPQINNVELTGNKSLNDLGIQPAGDYATANELSMEAEARAVADSGLQTQIDAITVSSDVIDVLGTYADLQAYDTSHVKANDIIKVMQDSTHNNAISYYRWVITSNVGAWVYVGSEGPYYTKSEANQTFQGKLTAGEGIEFTGNTIAAKVIYKNLLNKPREPYTPEAQTVDFLDLANGKVYDAMGDFTLARYSGQTVVTSIDVHAGDMFSVSEYNSTDGYSMITLFCNQGVFSFQSNLSDWSNGYLPNAHDIDVSLVVKPLPVEGNTESGTLTYECDVADLADGVYIAEQTTVLTGWVSGTLSISKTTEIKKVNDVLFIGNEIYTGYVLSTVVKQNVEAGDIVQTTGNNIDKVVSQAAWTANIGLEVL